MDTIQPAAGMELEGLGELVRLVVANAQHRGGHIYAGLQEDGNWIYFINHLVPNWFDMKGLPITLFVRTKESPSGSFIAYEYMNGFGKESWNFVNAVGENPKIAYIPIIKLKSIPKFIV